jgi:mannose-6-phosphate isomerase-like protein (cupin superfamily)
MDQIKLIAGRIADMREICDISAAEMAETIEVSEQEYIEYEQGKHDFAFSQLYRIAQRMGVDITNLLTGDAPKLKAVTFVRSGEGFSFDRGKEYNYSHLAFTFRDRKAEPFLVTKEYDANEEFLHFDSHEGQEFDYVLEGTMKISVDGAVFIMNPGDSIYYDATYMHSIKALGGDSCKFLAVIMN